MSPNQDRTSLLESLKRLYFKFMGLHVESSARSRGDHNNTAITQNIESKLSEYIDKLAANAVINPVTASTSQLPESENRPHDYAPFSQKSSSHAELGGLSKHMKDTHKYSGVSLNTGEKLIQSTWEHFHASIRLAHQGDVKTAKMHAELTRNALIEAAHYLPEAVYSRFSREVLKALEDSRAAGPENPDQ